MVRLQKLTKIVYLLKTWRTNEMDFRGTNRQAIQKHLKANKILKKLNIKNSILVSEDDLEFKLLHRLIRKLEFKLFGFFRNERSAIYSNILFLIQRDLLIIEQSRKEKAKIKFKLTLHSCEFFIPLNQVEIETKIDILSNNIVEAKKTLKMHLHEFIV